MANITITREEDGRLGRYVATVDGHEDAGELVFERVAPDLIVAVHTGVPESLGGLGIGSALVRRLVDDARSEGFRVVPRCSFVAAQAARHPEWSDVFVNG